MVTSLEIQSNTKNSFLLLLLSAIILLMAACNPYDNGRRNFFLRDHPHLVLYDFQEKEVSTYDYIDFSYNNSVITAEILRPDARLYDRNINRYFDGKLVSISRNGTTMQSYFENGLMQSFKIWYPNNRLSMDFNVVEGIGRAFKSDGGLVTAWLPESVIQYNPATGLISRIATDEQVEYYDDKGQLDYYSVLSDSSTTEYYSNSTKRFEILQLNNEKRRISRWYPNGQLEVTGVMRKGETIGEWVKYDSLGNVIEKVLYPS
jgi:hypothetical protein